MRKVRIILTVILVAILSGTLYSTALGENPITESNEIKWETYVDPKYDFSIDYPSTWYIRPRDDSQGIGATLAFSDLDFAIQSEEQNCSTHSLFEPKLVVEIGVYLVEWNSEQSLVEWFERYDANASAFDLSQIDIQSIERVQVDKQDALRKEGLSPLTKLATLHFL